MGYGSWTLVVLAVVAGLLVRRKIRSRRRSHHVEPSKPIEYPVRALSDPDLPALHGIRVIELAHVFAGPQAGRTLAELGAEVVKIEEKNVNTPPNRREIRSESLFLSCSLVGPTPPPLRSSMSTRCLLSWMLPLPRVSFLIESKERHNSCVS